VECSKTLDCFDPNPSKNQGGIAVVQPAICIQGNCIDRADTAGCNGKGWRDDDVSFTLNTIDRPAVYDCRGNGDGETVPTLTGDHQNRVTDYTAITYQQTTGPLMANSHPGSYTGQDAFNDMLVAKALRASDSDPQREDHATYPITKSLVRRLTPLECERLQGYPDGWTDLGEWTDSRGKAHQTSDSARYKALGNSIALPPWRFVLGRLNAYLTYHTMASLFDGIGGFPLIWQELNGPGKCLWASEIEEFPIAVTKRRFGIT
jgi:DNA (cytosine-5)-methyltransferase 1